MYIFSEGKVSRMGSFAFRASQFFESIGKKKRLSSVSSMSNLKERTSTTSSLASPITPLTPETPVFLPEIPSVPTARPISHQGKLYTCNIDLIHLCVPTYNLI